MRARGEAMRVASQGGTLPLWRGRSALPVRRAMPASGAVWPAESRNAPTVPFGCGLDEEWTSHEKSLGGNRRGGSGVAPPSAKTGLFFLALADRAVFSGRLAWEMSAKARP